MVDYLSYQLQTLACYRLSASGGDKKKMGGQRVGSARENGEVNRAIEQGMSKFDD